MSLLNVVPVERRRAKPISRRRRSCSRRRSQSIRRSHRGVSPRPGQSAAAQARRLGAVLSQAIEIDQTHVDARIECAAVLIEQGDPMKRFAS
jgi:hypothetical protein